MSKGHSSIMLRNLPSLASHSLGSSKPVVPTFSLSLHAPQHVRF
ncbi:hypothetical protein FOQG_09394 [Fusarium oxysporum f. sp. raphani 54005]|uniref:Uncharacterized protein n=5 Tax=Fusarium oxysporum TaxID=5507 RepID=W9IFS3_FUSOX|nr:hypothetical protein FOYG_08485 [Fusarium oxysporum NRRL 32931]EWZ37978.1 hypothetical protein FOZG_09775 [Fusarium oxysporum Fo47]EXK87109.1 hypothetical protein FOQG_09394 [Fusarium oxysporum f. sp. raphani 54005]EXM22632.1 hypothetical protein FOTG_09831 [Fusarium oxysporum f. sp. vasinfectum 25433]SCO77423.1 uncharacterized protein FRV6_01635 [Fusarium oxysporum]